jgi:hypothetical protein
MKEISEAEKWNAVWISYTHPGHHLARAISESLKECEKNPNVYFLENHGLIVVGDSSEEALRLHEEVNELLKSRYTIETVQSPEIHLESPFFPDQEVFCGEEIDIYTEKELEVRREMLAAANIIHQNIKRAGFKPKFINDEGRQYLRAMDAEKYRKEILKK